MPIFLRLLGYGGMLVVWWGLLNYCEKKPSAIKCFAGVSAILIAIVELTIAYH